MVLKLVGRQVAAWAPGVAALAAWSETKFLEIGAHKPGPLRTSNQGFIHTIAIDRVMWGSRVDLDRCAHWHSHLAGSERVRLEDRILHR